MNWQEWVVGLLIVLCVARILYGIYLFFRRVKENDNPCACLLYTSDAADEL